MIELLPLPPDQDEAFWRPRVAATVAFSMHDNIPACLYADSFAFDWQARTIWLKAHLDAVPSADDVDLIECIETELIAHFMDWFHTATEYELLIYGREPRCLPDGTPYRRAGPPFALQLG